MDCKSPIAMLADLSARKAESDGAARAHPFADPVLQPNFDEFSDSPRFQVSESPFLGLGRRFQDPLMNNSPQISGFMEVGDSPFIINNRKQYAETGARKPGMESPQARLGRPASANGMESPMVSETKLAGALDQVKSSPRMAVLMQAATCSDKDKQKKKRQPPNPERKSNFRGVSWQKTSKAWVAQYKSGGKTTYLGLFGTEEEAARAYDVAVYLKGGKNLNFGTPSEDVLKQYRANGNIPAGRLGATVSKRAEEKIRPRLEQPSASAATAAALAKADKGATSNYRGVSWYAARQIWKASIQVNRKKEYIGRFETEEEAARAYNKRAMELRGADAILNVVPDTITRYPPGTVPLSLEQLAALEAKELEKKDKKDKKRGASALESSTSSSSSSATANDTDDEHKPKKQRMGNVDKRGDRASVFLPTGLTMPGTPDMTRTPMLQRLGENESRNLGLPLTKPSFMNDEDEVGMAMRSVTAFDSPLFISPMPSVQTKRAIPNTDALHTAIPFTAPTTINRMPTLNSNNFTPMLQNLFDSPYPLDAAGIFTPSETLAVPRLDFSTTARKGRKALAPFT